MPKRLLLTTLCALVALALVPAAAAAKRGPCIPGTSAPRCTIWTATVITVHDGDTFDARVGRRKRRVRMVGLNAMEQRVYSRTPSRRRGACHAVEATARLESLLGRGGRRIRLVAQKASSRSRHRIRRAVYVRSGGRWLDAAQVLLSEGHALWLPNIAEYAWHRSHSAAAEQAAARGLRLWDTNACGRGPSEEVPLRLWMNPDAEGNDNANVNGEWIRVKNLHASRSLPLGGWWLRDSAHRRFRFPASASIPPGGTITVRMGHGRTSAYEFFWGLADAVFENPTDDEQARGDGSYLFDPQGDLRAWMQYPCRVTC